MSNSQPTITLDNSHDTVVIKSTTSVSTDSDSTDSDSTASDSTASDSTASDSTNSDSTGSDSTNSDSTNSDSTNSDSTDSDSTMIKKSNGLLTETIDIVITVLGCLVGFAFSTCVIVMLKKRRPLQLQHFRNQNNRLATAAVLAQNTVQFPNPLYSNITNNEIDPPMQESVSPQMIQTSQNQATQDGPTDHNLLSHLDSVPNK
ncbi:hypothetical protein Bbelb_017710 [Branchiostoma belcheri]|nr:hypothetical protein Bbelb_017710 [Branchiostoma belcheri]